MDIVELTQRLADHAANFPADGVAPAISDALALNLVDALAAIIGGAHAPGVGALASILKVQSATGAARQIAGPGRYPAIVSAQINATAGHALDYDDTLDEGGGMHAGALVHSAALAVADELGTVSGRDYVSAVAVGLDIAVRLALAPTRDFGWHRTSAFGIFGVVGAVGRLLKLDREQFLNAFGIAYSQASGNRQCILDGALSKRLQAGFAARDGIIAVQLAQAGVTGAHQVFEGRDGFFNLYQRGDYAREVILDGLGERLLSDRISLKPYPCGRNLHGLLDASFQARAQHATRQIERIEVRVSARAAEHARLEWPRQVVEAQFSIPFVLALSTVTGRTDLADFDAPDRVSPAVKALAERIAVRAHDSDGATDHILFRYADGSAHEEPVSTPPLGHPSRPLSLAAIGAKLRANNDFAGSPIPAARLEEVLTLASSLATLETTEALTRLLTTEG